MSFACPHCNVAIPGVLTEDKHVERLKAKDELNKTLTDQLKAAQEAAAKLPDIQTERDAYASKIKAMERGLALASKGINDEKVRRTVEIVYDAEMSGRAPEDVVPFEDFETWAGDHPLLASAFKSATPVVPGVKPPAVAPATPRVVAPPTPQPRMTPAQLDAYFQSAEWKALPMAERRAKLPELQRQVAGPG